MAKRPDNAGKIFAATFKLAAEHGWRRISLDDIAAEAKVRPATARDLFPSKRAILAGFAERIDERSLADGVDEGAVRDRLFELIMRRLDALAPYKADLDILSRRPFAVDPCTCLCAGKRLMKSMAATLDAAGVGPRGPFGRVRTKALMLIYLATLRVWFADDSADATATMAALDKYLRRAEGLAELCAAPRRRRPAAPESA